jgi:hypothetical protein
MGSRRGKEGGKRGFGAKKVETRDASSLRILFKNVDHYCR